MKEENKPQSMPPQSAIDWEKYDEDEIKNRIKNLQKDVMEEIKKSASDALIEEIKKSMLDGFSPPAIPGLPPAPSTKKITQTEIIEKLDTLYKRILSGEEWEVRALDIYYIGYCRGIVEEAGTLPKEDMLKLNKLWIKYKKVIKKK